MKKVQINYHIQVPITCWI